MPHASCNTLATQEMFSWYPTKELSAAFYSVETPGSPLLGHEPTHYCSNVSQIDNAQFADAIQLIGLRAAEHGARQPLTDVAILLVMEMPPVTNRGDKCQTLGSSTLGTRRSPPCITQVSEVLAGDRSKPELLWLT